MRVGDTTEVSSRIPREQIETGGWTEVLVCIPSHEQDLPRGVESTHGLEESTFLEKLSVGVIPLLFVSIVFPCG